jgi:uncharacterized membrane protein YraQ (UPF0718 family)
MGLARMDNARVRGRLDMTIARVIAIVVLLVAIGWVFYTMIYPNLRRR